MAGARLRKVAKVVCCIALGVALAAPALFVNTAIGYAPAIAYVVLLGLCYAYVRVLERGMAYEVKLGGGQCHRGEKSDFSLSISNRTILPAVRVEAQFFLSDLFGGEGFTDARHITLGPRSSRDFDFGTRFDHIGTYEVGLRRFALLDPIGVFVRAHENSEMAQVRVLPRLFDVSDLPLSTDSAIEAKRNFTTVLNEGMDYASVRTYEWGDPIKTIHWKLSARMPSGEYLTRLYETNANPGIAIIADFDAPDYTVEQLMGIYDTIVECAFSVERFAEENGLDAELIFQDKSKATRRFFTPMAEKRLEILECIPKIYSPGSGREALALIRGELQSRFAQYNLVVCTSVISRELVESLVAARAGKRSPMLLAVIPDTADDARRKELLKRMEPLAAAGVYYRVISHATALGDGEAGRLVEDGADGAAGEAAAGRPAEGVRAAGDASEREKVA